MGPRYFINRESRLARISYDREIEGFEQVTREQFEQFRAENRTWFAQQVAM